MQLNNDFKYYVTTMYYVNNGDPLCPNKNNNQKVIEEQAVGRVTNCYVIISLINLKVSAICTVQQYSNVKKFHEGKLRPV